MKEITRIDIGLDFARDVGGRYREEGPFSGQQFYEEKLLPAYRESKVVVVALDNLDGYTASFFDESLGGLVRKYGEEVFQKVRLEAIEGAYLVDQVLGWMQDALTEKDKPRRSATG